MSDWKRCDGTIEVSLAGLVEISSGDRTYKGPSKLPRLTHVRFQGNSAGQAQNITKLPEMSQGAHRLSGAVLWIAGLPPA